MPLNEDDVREILRLIDESNLAELRIEIGELSLHVVRDAEPAETTTVEAPAAPVDAAADGLVAIEAPTVGTFYRAPAPGAPPFVDVGASVEPDTVVCLI